MSKQCDMCKADVYSLVAIAISNENALAICKSCHNNLLRKCSLSLNKKKDIKHKQELDSLLDQAERRIFHSDVDWEHEPFDKQEAMYNYYMFSCIARRFNSIYKKIECLQGRKE